MPGRRFRNRPRTLCLAAAVLVALCLLLNVPGFFIEQPEKAEAAGGLDLTELVEAENDSKETGNSPKTTGLVNRANEPAHIRGENSRGHLPKLVYDVAQTKRKKPVTEQQARDMAYHVLVTTEPTNYSRWQTAVLYTSYLKAKKDYPKSDMGGFTRILHGNMTDDWMEWIPTVVVKPLSNRVLRGYKPMNRPFALVQFFKYHDIKENYIMLVDPDFVFVSPPPNWATPTMPAGYPFAYLRPDSHVHALAPYNTKHIGIRYFYHVCAPHIMHKEQSKKVAKQWHKVLMKMRKDPAVQLELGWVQEMYAFLVAAATVPGGPIHFSYRPDMLVEPPFANSLTMHLCSWCGLTKAHIIHYTQDLMVDEGGRIVQLHEKERLPEVVWVFRKRQYNASWPPKPFPMPPQGSPEVVMRVAVAINDAAEIAPGWPSS